MTKFSILDKSRAPSRIAFCEGLVGWFGSSELPRNKPSGLCEVHRGDAEPDGDSERGEFAHPARRLEAVGDGRNHRHLTEDVSEGLHLSEIRQPGENEHEAHQRQQRSNCIDHIVEVIVLVHRLSPFEGTVLDGTLPPRSTGFWNSDNIANIAYMSLKVKPNRKSLYLKAFSRFQYWIKKFSSPKIKIWFESMFFSGFFCGFERCGSAAFPNFRGGNSSPPTAAKCVRTIFRILHHVGKIKRFWFASLRSATNLYSILGVKTNSRFRILGEENFLILNQTTI